MRHAEYEALVPRLLASRDNVSTLARARTVDGGAPYSFNTLMAIYTQQYQRQMAARARELAAQLPRLLRELDDTATATDDDDDARRLVRIAERMNVAPALLARRVLERRLPQRSAVLDGDGSGVVASAAQVTGALRDMQQLRALVGARLQRQVQACLAADRLYGPDADHFRHVIGLEYEYILTRKLRALGVVDFECERDLRARGEHKTPDVVLRGSAMRVHCGHDGNEEDEEEGEDEDEEKRECRTVLWIDSKAKFGDARTLARDYEEALSAYAGRYGPGMVIYWFGFVHDAPQCPALADRAVLVSDAFPARECVELVASAPRGL